MASNSRFLDINSFQQQLQKEQSWWDKWINEKVGRNEKDGSQALGKYLFDRGFRNNQLSYKVYTSFFHYYDGIFDRSKPSFFYNSEDCTKMVKCLYEYYKNQ